MSIREGRNTAIDLAISLLKKTDLVERCHLHDFPPFLNGVMPIRLFGKDMLFSESNLSLKATNTYHTITLNQYILFLHYLLCDIPVTPTGRYITFRQLPGGQFYWSPFLAKTIEPLVKRTGNDIELIQNKIAKFDWEPEKYGDFSARIHAVGKIFIILIYRMGDDEFPASAKLLFDSSIAKVFPTEDVSILSYEICSGLYKE